jgi:uncharacterized membrane protein (DUF106 family)
MDHCCFGPYIIIIIAIVILVIARCLKKELLSDIKNMYRLKTEGNKYKIKEPKQKIEYNEKQ